MKGSDYMDTIIHNLEEIIKAMDNLQLTGYNQCKIFANVVEAIELTKSLAIHIKEEQEKENDFKEETNSREK